MPYATQTQKNAAHRRRYKNPELRAKKLAGQRARHNAETDDWRKQRRLKKYKITLDEYRVLEKAQNFRCGICAKEAWECRGRWGCFAVDHDHKTGQVRGLLCFDCNTAIGKLDDDAALVLKAATYLEKHK
jgi:hypothetical protein